jgi:peptide deformylase
MLLEILHYPNPILRESSKPVTEFDSSLEVLAQNMLETMYQAHGIGLAAPQIGELKQFLVIDCRPQDESGRYEIERQTELEQKILQPLFMANPKVLTQKGSTTYREGCLSVPSFYETVKRHKHIIVQYQDLQGNPQTLETDGLLAIVIQHEMDHLAGTLFIDHLSFSNSQKIKKQIEKSGYPTKT